VSGIIVTGRCRSLHACYQSIACCFMAAVARIPDARTPADAAKQRTVAYLSDRGRGNRCFCHRELITIVTPLNRPGSAKTAASVCLYCVYRKQERSLFTAALEQTSNVPTNIIRPRPTAGLWSPIPSIRSAIASLRRAARLLFDRFPFNIPNNNNILLTEVNKTVMFIVPNIYYCGHTHTHSLSVYVTLNDLGTYIFVKPVPIYDF